jgi:hypothetical protein
LRAPGTEVSVSPAREAYPSRAAARAAFAEHPERFRRFESEAQRLAGAEGLSVELTRNEGVWEGEWEPSYRVDVRGGDPGRAREFAHRLGREFGQDSALTFVPDPAGGDAEVHLLGGDPDRVVEALRGAGFPGAARDPDGTVRVAVFGEDVAGQSERLAAVARGEGVSARAYAGHVDLPDLAPAELETKTDHRNALEAGKRFTGDDLSPGMAFAINTRRVVTVTADSGQPVAGRVEYVGGDPTGGDVVVQVRREDGATFAVSQRGYGWFTQDGRLVTELDVAADDRASLPLDGDVRAVGDRTSAEAYLAGVSRGDVRLDGLDWWQPRALQEVAQSVKDVGERLPSVRANLLGVVGTDAAPTLSPETRRLGKNGDVWATTGADLETMLPRAERHPSYVVLASPTEETMRGVAKRDEVPYSEVRVDGDRDAGALSGAIAHADARVYGRMTHELGHVWAAANGYGSASASAEFMERVGLSPHDMALVSQYGASHPAEAFAEAFTTVYTPGELDRLAPDLQEKLRAFRALVESEERGR